MEKFTQNEILWIANEFESLSKEYGQNVTATAFSDLVSYIFYLRSKQYANIAKKLKKTLKKEYPNIEIVYKKGVDMMNDKTIRHKAICEELNALYAKKNHDYGDSFHQTFIEEGMAMPRIRLGDKLNRFKALSSGQNQQVSDESMRDTLMDLANYSIMTILELEDEKECGNESW